MQRLSFAAVAVCMLCIGISGYAGEKETKKKNDPLAKAFTQLKAMAGEWQIVDGSKGLPKSKVIYRLTASGSTVMETLFAGTKMEMISMYHRDGKHLMMTHYCAAQNQPRFRAKLDKKSGDLIFKFAGGTNLNPKKDMHVHGGRIRFVDANTVSAAWEFWMNGKKAGEHKITMKRVK